MAARKELKRLAKILASKRKPSRGPSSRKPAAAILRGKKKPAPLHPRKNMKGKKFKVRPKDHRYRPKKTLR